MPPRRWRMGRRLPLLPDLEHYLVTGCYICGDVSLTVYRLASQVIRGELDRLRAIWDVHQATVRAAHPDETTFFAEVALRGEDLEDWYEQLRHDRLRGRAAGNGRSENRRSDGRRHPEERTPVTPFDFKTTGPLTHHTPQEEPR